MLLFLVLKNKLNVYPTLYYVYLVMCSCANQTFTDGGLDYQRINEVDLNLVKDLSEFKEIKNNE